ncbi:MAG: hypothetical protein EOM62_11685 [Bacteroidia bacterium]|nr:hypothetical protein [Bacteroidia bacterium]
MTSTSFQIPPFIRILVADDQVAASRRHREFFRNILTSLAFESASPDLPLHVEVIFEQNPAKGFKRWLDEPFDLALIDADFSANSQAPGHEIDDLTKYVLNSRDQGLRIVSLMKESISDVGPGQLAFRRDKCEAYLWTALEWEDAATSEKQPEKPGLNTLLKRFNLGEANVLHKIDKELSDYKEIISKLVGYAQAGNFTPEQSIERLLYAVRHDIGGIRRDLAGGCLIADSKEEYPFLPLLGNHQGQNTDKVRLCAARIPEPFLKGDMPCVPLHPCCAVTALEAVTHLSNKEATKSKGIATEYCKALDRRISARPTPKNRLKIKKPPREPEFIAAATPVTGISVTGGNDAVTALADKIHALLAGPFDKLVLKTTYLDSLAQWKNTEWPSVQVQSHMRSRCLFPETGTATLWNSGKTCMETLPPRQMNQLLTYLLGHGLTVEQSTGVVVSLGSKYPMGTGMARIYGGAVAGSLSIIWQQLFGEVFANLPFQAFSYVEINVRHFLREIVTFHLGGDEYLTPRTLNEKAVPDPARYWQEFKTWLDVVHRTAVASKKKLILKMPYRSDALAHVECVVSLREHHLVACHGTKAAEYGVRGLTVVNALKTPVPRREQNKSARIPSWYANPEAWGDARGKLYQMSGRFVGPYRNQILTGLMSALPTLRSQGLEVWISGGLTSANEIKHCLALETASPEHGSSVLTGIQIGTWALISTDFTKDGKKNWLDRKGAPGPAEPAGPFQLVVSDCKKECCNTIHTDCPHDALEKKEKGQPVVIKDAEQCLFCTEWACLQACKSKKLYRILHAHDEAATQNLADQAGDEAAGFTPRFSYVNVHRCKACGQCSQTMYCDTFIDRANPNLPPLMDSRNCTGCGLCVQVCSSGALHLYPPENFLVLLSPSGELKEILDSLCIPNLQYRPEHDLNKFPDWVVSNVRKTQDSKKKEGDVKKIWDKRIDRDKFMLHQDEPKLYPDRRGDEARKKRCIETAATLLEQAGKAETDNSSKTFNRAAVWCQLIWSDPGQVLWDSFLLSIQSVIVDTDGNPVAHDALPDRGTAFRVSTWVILLRQGDILVQEEMRGDPMVLNLEDDAFDAYRKSVFGKGRAARLDARACGNSLVSREDKKPLEPDDLMELAGLPWRKIRDAVNNLPDEHKAHRLAFNRLCQAVPR